jgi:hypothetical protein
MFPYFHDFRSLETCSYERDVTLRCRYRLLYQHWSVAILSLNRKITSYIYLLIFTKSLWLHVKHFIALMKRESVRRIVFFVITDQDYPCQHINQWPRKTRESMTALVTKKKKKRVRIKRVKSDSYLTYGQSRKTYGIIRDTPPPRKKIIFIFLKVFVV